jgi:DNA-binding winged helix-turn-helix (wHTH) protein/Flp pilus assembly protein TadD
MDAPTEIRFDGWTLLRPSGELLREGTRIRLQTQPLQILEELLARPGELVTREQLIARLWPKGVVDFDTALNSAIRRLRIALGDHAETPRYIETIPRRGYRFIGQLDACAPAAQDAVAAPVGAAVAMAFAAPPAPPAPVAPYLRWGATAAAALLLAVALIGAWAVRVEHPLVVAARPAESASASADERYQRAQFFFHRRSPGDVALARKYYQDAIQIDPGHARAWAGLAGTYWIDTVHGDLPREQGLSKVRHAAERALELDPGIAEAHVRLAGYWRFMGDRPASDEHLRLALELEPANPLVLVSLASEHQQQGRFDEAIKLQRRAVEADPLSVLNRYNLGSMLYLAGRLADAETELLEVRELNPAPEYSNEALGRVLILAGRYGEAAELAEAWADGASRRFVLAMAWHRMGRSEEADAALRALTESPRGEDLLRIVEVYAFRGDIDAAFRWLLGQDDGPEAGSRVAANSGFEWMIPLSPFLVPLHSDPRWTAWREAEDRERELHAATTDR